MSSIGGPATKRLKTMKSLTVPEESSAAEMVARTEAMEARAKEGQPFTETELDDVIKSLQNVTPETSKIDWGALGKLLLDFAHYSHKDWNRTGGNSEKLARKLIPDGMSAEARQMFERIVNEGNWDAAINHASTMKNSVPWAVLVTGVNGIRKTTAMYQSWFPELLQEALLTPPDAKTDFRLDELPCGENSFFRQLDHMITTLCNEEFTKLYALTGAQMSDETPPKELIQKYSNLKAAIFTRFRTLSELVGVLLLREAQKVNINCMLETSGRDVAMFHYVDSFFPKGYHKIALHFTINDLSYAQQSVDNRMVKEIEVGQEALESGDAFQIVYANAGGPYGSEVLPGVQADSDRVWNESVLSGDVGQDWYKATIAINAHPTEPWTAQAVRPDGTLGTLFKFGAPREVKCK
eukprot:CAMPEP_0178921866 /NCGR_PEP_ID=MMETSP0786-20121207/15807_1 /TAXON_ID=186022 /ORGANISM="Thalassionema frauenfeldii, Strain CCMP 1798" /LENGTH=408 /DNA_ID=CAMNT_0020596109 /DNA_START=174 /DNA_END=1400 /DNA_ORIENTATION=+